MAYSVSFRGILAGAAVLASLVAFSGCRERAEELKRSRDPSSSRESEEDGDADRRYPKKKPTPSPTVTADPVPAPDPTAKPGVPAMPVDLDVQALETTSTEMRFEAAWSAVSGASAYVYSGGANSGSSFRLSEARVSALRASFAVAREAADFSGYFCVAAEGSAGRSENRCTVFKVPGKVVPSPTPTATPSPSPSAPPSLPPSGETLHPNEPAGFRPLTERSFEATAEEGWKFNPTDNFQIVNDSGAPYSASKVGQARFPAGWGGGHGPMITWSPSFYNPMYRRVYLSFWIKLSANWQGHSSGVNKIYFFNASKPSEASINGHAIVYLSAHGIGSGPLVPQVRLQPTGGARNLTPNQGSFEIQRGKWHRWETLLVMNTGSNADGEAHWWIDGRKAGAYMDLWLGDVGDRRSWIDVNWNPIWGGMGDVLKNEQFMWMDHIYLSGRE